MRNLTRRRLAIFVALLMTAAIAACGDDDGGIFPPGATTTVGADGATTTAQPATTTLPPTTQPPTTQPPTTQPPTTQPPTTQPPTTQAPGTTSQSGALDYSQTAYYDEFDLSSGFDGDPWAAADVNAGSLSPVDVSYLGGSCNGYANDIPDFEVTYQDGGYTASVLRFYFVPDTAGDDTVLIVNAPDGSWYCGDDSYGTRDPTVDFPTPTYGVYDIWIGTYEEGVLIAGTLYITELDGNHP